MRTIKLACPRCGAAAGEPCIDARRIGEPRRHTGDRHHNERAPFVALDPDLVAFLAGRR